MCAHQINFENFSIWKYWNIKKRGIDFQIFVTLITIWESGSWGLAWMLHFPAPKMQISEGAKSDREDPWILRRLFSRRGLHKKRSSSYLLKFNLFVWKLEQLPLRSRSSAELVNIWSPYLLDSSTGRKLNLLSIHLFFSFLAKTGA